MSALVLIQFTIAAALAGLFAQVIAAILLEWRDAREFERRIKAREQQWFNAMAEALRPRLAELIANARPAPNTPAPAVPPVESATGGLLREAEGNEALARA